MKVFRDTDWGNPVVIGNASTTVEALEIAARFHRALGLAPTHMHSVFPVVDGGYDKKSQLGWAPELVPVNESILATVWPEYVVQAAGGSISGGNEPPPCCISVIVAGDEPVAIGKSSWTGGCRLWSGAVIAPHRAALVQQISGGGRYDPCYWNVVFLGRDGRPIKAELAAEKPWGYIARG